MLHFLYTVRFKVLFKFSVLLTMVHFMVACGGGSDSSPAPTPEPPVVETRSFNMGFTPWPYAATTEAVDYVYSEIIAKGDIIAHHVDSGIPWQEALDGSNYPVSVINELNSRQQNTPLDKTVFLTISPLNGARDNLAGYWNDTGTGQALSAPWNSRDFDSPEVIQAYINFASYAIDLLNPEYFNMALEVSELAINDAQAFDSFVIFTEQVSARLRQDYPNLKLMLSVAMKSPGSAAATVINTQIPRLVAYVDVVGVSTYPYVFFDHADKGDPANLPVDWLSQIQTISAGKPLAITETGWIAEQLVIPNFSVDVAANATNQADYLTVLFNEADNLNLEFIVWFSVVDFDTLWTDSLGEDDIARIWRDIGLYDENLNPRPALAIWQQEFNKPLIE